MPRSTGQLEQEAEQARADLSATLDALRSRLTPGQLLDDFMDSARDGAAGRFVQNLGRNVQENPLPLALVGVGLAWTMIATASSRRDGGSTRAGDSTRPGHLGPDDIQEGFGGGIDSLSEKAGHTTDRFGGKVAGKIRKGGHAVAGAREGIADATIRATHTVSSVGSAASDLYQRTARAGSKAGSRVAGQASELADRMGSAGRGFVDFCKEQPVVLVGLGLAIGAAIGALLPVSRTEDRLLGEASKRIKEQARELAESAYEAGGDAASKATGQAASAATKPASAASEALEDVGPEGALQAGPSGSRAPALQGNESASLVPSEDQGSSPDLEKTMNAAGDRRD
jgi:ElaB/YqjD/DUF883 family membrane-anchored ribosome-binding protein